MSVPDNMSSYTPVEVSTPTKSNYNTPISTPSRVALLKPNFLTSDSPIKFSLTPDKVKLKDVELDDWETEEPESRASRIGKLVLRILIFLSWLILLAAAIYLSVEYITTAALAILRWTQQEKSAYKFGLVVTTLGAGFSIGYLILRFLKFPSTPWRGSFDQPRPLIVNWFMFIVFLVGLPVACTIVPFILGRSGQFNASYQAWNNACSDSRFTSKLHLKYIATIGNSYSMTMYARDTQGSYHYLGLLPTNNNPGGDQVTLSTPNFILFPTTNPITPDAAAGQRMFTITTNDYTPTLSQLVATLSLNASDSDNQYITAKCLNSTNPTGELTTCLNGELVAGTGIITGPVGANPFLRGNTNRTKTFETTYDILPAETDQTNTTYLRGYLDSWPSDTSTFMPGGIASQSPPSGQLELSDSEGVILDKDGVQVISAPWPGCDGLMVCSTQGINGMIAAGWIWEHLDQWMWYSQEDCLV